MAKLLLKKSSVDGNAAGTSDIDYGELAINYRNGRLFYKDNSNNIDNFIDSDLINAKYLSKAGGTMSGIITMGDNKIVSLATPVDSADAVPKYYVDSAIDNFSAVNGTPVSYTHLTLPTIYSV